MKQSKILLVALIFSIRPSIAHVDLATLDAPPPHYSLPENRSVCGDICTTPTNVELLSATAIIPNITEEPLALQNFLIYDMYHVTYPLQTRALATYPSLSPLLQERPSQPWDMTIKPFFIYMPKARFRNKSTKISSYITLLTQHNFLQDLDDNLISGFDIPQVLPLLGGITLEQRSLGALLFFQGSYERWFGSITLPVYYLENNYQLSQADKDRFENSALFVGETGPRPTLIPSLDANTFTADHFISDKLGIGDLRCEAWYRAAESSRGYADVGLQMTFQTAHAVDSGIIGAMPGTLCRGRPVPYFDLQTIASLYSAWQAGSSSAGIDLSEYLVCLGLESLDRLSATILNTPLGEQHTTIGAVATCVGHTTDPDLSCQISGECTYYIPSQELRMFKTIDNPEAIIQRNYEDLDQAQANLNFLSERATNILFPVGTRIVVHPGWMVNITAALLFEKPSYHATLGLNMWAHTKESFGAITERYPVIDPLRDQFFPPRYIPYNNLDIDQGTRPGAYAGKLFGSVTSIIRSDDSYNTRVGLRGDATLFSSQIGADFTVAADFIIDF